MEHSCRKYFSTAPRRSPYENLNRRFKKMLLLTIASFLFQLSTARGAYQTVVSSGFSYFILLFFPLRTHEQFDIFIDCADSGNAEGLHQHLGHIG